MTALHAISSALSSLNDDPASDPSDDFQFESEYVKSLLKQRTPSPIIPRSTISASVLRNSAVMDKENIPEKWRTPVTMGPSAGRSVLANRDINSFTRSQSMNDTPSLKQTTPAVMSSSQPAPTTHGSTRYPRRGRLTRLGPAKRTSRLSSDSLETPSESDTPPHAGESKTLSILSTIPSTGNEQASNSVEAEKEEPKGLKGLIQLQHQQFSLNVNGQFTPPASQSTPPLRQQFREQTPQEEQEEEVEPSVRARSATPGMSQLGERRISSGSSGTSASSSASSGSKSLGRSSLRSLLASTSPQIIDPALEGVQKGLEALAIKSQEAQSKFSIPPYQNRIPLFQRPAPSTKSPPLTTVSQQTNPSPPLTRNPTPPNTTPQLPSPNNNDRDITQEYIPPPGIKINTLPVRRKSTSPIAQVQHAFPPHVIRPQSQSPKSHYSAAPSERPRSRSPVRLKSPVPQRVSPQQQNGLHPPPKMKVLEEPKSPKKGKAVVLVNTRPYTRLSTIGRGGSSKVYKVISTQTNKIYALKKVSFDKADQSAIAGYKNEIRLLNRMAERENQMGESRCVRLFDWEVCDEKGYLLMLMECGEIDFAHILAKHQGVPLGLNFIRVYWEQMLRAVQAIHEEKIVHSDLKPANFLLVQGQLKLIDFGIAKRMGDDTTNIHRDQQIGTVNYMSPEAILDTNHNNPHLPPGTRLMKLGKKSDVWSLGCILYQMIYGKTPFSDLTMYQKIQSIPDDNFPIKFPAVGTGNIPVDRGLERCVRMCLVRDQKKRWGIEDLLGDRFLRGEDDERFVGISVDEIRSLIEQTLGFGRMSGGNGLSKETIETLAKDAFEKLKATRARE